MSRISAGLSAFLLVSLSLAQERPPTPEQRLKDLLRDDPTAALRLARMDGRYSMLLAQFRAEERGDPIQEKGHRGDRRYKGQRVPAGHWVYVRPYWFVFRDHSDDGWATRRWGPEQATGAPDTPEPGDRETAWAAKLADNAETEWLLLEFPKPVKATAVEIHETFNPGAVTKVSLFKPDGEELEVWTADAAPIEAARRVLEVALPLGFTVQRVKLYFDTAAVPGWNEIDAVALIDHKGPRHWATAAEASTTYGGDRHRLEPDVLQLPVAQPRLRVLPVQGIAPIDPVALENARLKQTLEALEARVAALEVMVQALQKALAEKK